MENALIRFDQVEKSFGSNKAIDGMSFNVKSGEILGFLGPNGSGKTTTVRLLNGVIYPDTGSIQVKGLDTLKNGTEIRKVTGVLTETASLYGNMTALENLEFFADLYGAEKKNIRSRALYLLERFDLSERQNSKVDGFSTGMKKRLGIAKALVHKPEILFLDEPTSGLDPEASRNLVQYIKKLNEEEKITIFVCTHNLAEAEHFCTRFIFLDKGRILENGTLQELDEKYTAAVRLKVDFKGNLKEDSIEGCSFERLKDGTLLIELPGRKLIPGVVRSLSLAGDLFGVQIDNSSLESLYFEVRRRFYEQTGN